jgi:DNA helicase HerA-like ATPase
MMKQARAFGVGVILATQNPMDLDYRALSNAGLWWIGRLSTDGDTDRLLDGMGLSRDDREEVGALVRRLRPRWFLERSIYTERALLQPRWAMSLMRGPMTRAELLMALEMGARES